MKQNNVGRLAPQDTEIEAVILGGLILENVDEIKWNSVKAEMFYKDSHQKIFHAISTLRHDKSKIDIRTVTAKLREHGELERVGGSYAIVELTNGVVSTANMEYHARIIHQLFLKRELIRISTECISGMYEDTEDPLQAMKRLVMEIKDLERGIFKRQEKTGVQLAKEAWTEINAEKVKGLLGNTYGIKGIDHILKGKQKGTMIALPAATSMGKSALMCNLAKNSCFDENNELLEDQRSCAIFSLEMKSVELTFRILGSLSDVPVEKIQLNEMNDIESDRVFDAVNKFEKCKIIIDDTPGITITELEVKIATLVAIYDIKEVYIDYIQLIRFDKANKNMSREEGYSDCSRRIKTLAGELGITIFVFSQVTEDVKGRHLKIPTTDDIKYCKAIANDADVVAFLYRPAYYPDVLEQINSMGGIQCALFNNMYITDMKDVAFLIITKHRNGKLGNIPLRIKLDIMKISDHPQVLENINGTPNNELFNTFERKIEF